MQAQNQWTRQEVEDLLRNAFNAEPDSHDSNALDTFVYNQEFFESQYGSIYELPGVAICWVQILIDTPVFLKTYSEFLYAIPECRENMEKIFGNPEQNCKVGFIRAFFSIAENKEKLEQFYAHTCVKAAFQFMLEKNPILLNRYYQDVLSVFKEHHENMAAQTLSEVEFANMPKQTSSDIPSCIHFDLQKFLLSLQPKRTLTPINNMDLPWTKKAKALPSQIQTALFSGNNESNTTGTLDTAQNLDMDSSHASTCSSGPN